MLKFSTDYDIVMGHLNLILFITPARPRLQIDNTGQGHVKILEYIFSELNCKVLANYDKYVAKANELGIAFWSGESETDSNEVEHVENHYGAYNI